jgi:LysW-gamma-L-lysine carboxypeptidase
MCWSSAVDEVAFLRDLISIPSPSGQEDAVADYLIRQMTTLGYRARPDKVGNVVGELGALDAERNIVLLGHIDTVPGPITVRQAENRLYGRGAVDAKGPLAAFVLAAARVAPTQKRVCLTVIGAVGEEARSPGAHHLARTMQPPECVIIGEPSGWEGITLGYKGALSVGFRWVEPARHGASGRPAPAEVAVAFWDQLAAYAASRNEGRTWRFDTLDPTLQAISTFDDGLEQGVEMSINLRLPPDLDVAALRRQMQSWCTGAELTFPYDEPPFVEKKNTPPVRALLRAIRRQGGQPRFKLKTGTSDMNVVGTAWSCPVVAYGPGDSALDHTPDEHIEITEFLKAIDVLAHALELLTA